MIRSTTSESTCADRDSATALGAYADGELGPVSALEIESHMRRCPECAARVGLLRALRASLRRTRAWGLGRKGPPGDPEPWMSNQTRCAASQRCALASRRDRARGAARRTRARWLPRATWCRRGRRAALTRCPRDRDRSVGAKGGRRAVGRAPRRCSTTCRAARAAAPARDHRSGGPPRFDPFAGKSAQARAQAVQIDFTGARLHAIRDGRARCPAHGRGRAPGHGLLATRKLPAGRQSSRGAGRGQPVYVGPDDCAAERRGAATRSRRPRRRESAASAVRVAVAGGDRGATRGADRISPR
jgi:anti-sigma factor RsiW